MTYRLATIRHDFHSRVSNDRSRSSEFDDFHVIWKRLCDFLLVISSNLGTISSFLRYGELWVEKRTFSYHCLTANLKIFLFDLIVEVMRGNSRAN